ncbi:MAG TPA: nuclear transport factor 2 family protein [Candidatus Acidoferrum sp.]|nr:nuclear transport factor 2 family protein [Candidatus Acidoferrum sp.]
MKFAKTLIALIAALAASGVKTEAQPAATQELTGLLGEFMDAAGRGDRAVFNKFFGDDVIYTRASGVVIGKAEIMANVGKTSTPTPTEKTTYSAEDITVHEYGEMAVVAFRLVGRTEREGKVVTAYYRNTGTFLHRDGRWQAVAWQATKMGEGSATPK